MAEPTNGWTISTLKIHLTEMINASDHHFCAAIGSAEKQILDKMRDADIRYEQRFQALTDMIAAAAMASKEGIAAAFAAAEARSAAAISNADRAVTKAEVAAQGSLAAIRVDLDQRIGGVLSKIEGENGLNGRVEALARRVDSFVAHGIGRDETTQTDTRDRQWMIGLWVVGVVSIVAAAISLV